MNHNFSNKDEDDFWDAYKKGLKTRQNKNENCLIGYISMRLQVIIKRFNNDSQFYLDDLLKCKMNENEAINFFQTLGNDVKQISALKRDLRKYVK